MSDLYISTPVIYKNRPGALNELGEITARFASVNKKVLIIFSRTAKEKVGEKIYEQLKQAGISYEEEIFTGFPSERQAREYARTANEKNVDAVIGVGGGRTMDVTKAAGTLGSVKVITVPTIAATCAAWAAVSILYTDDGDYDRGYMNPGSPAAIVVDTQIIAQAPIRYLKAGIADTLAKWYEPDYGKEFHDRISSYGAKLAYDTIRESALSVISNAGEGIVDEDTIKIVDAIIYLAGFVGSFIGAKAFSGIAHPFYHAGRGVAATRQKLHGEVVSYGLVLQGVYEGRSYEELTERMQLLHDLDNLFTSEEIGYREAADYEFVVKRIQRDFPFIDDKQGTKIRTSFETADAYVKRFRKEL